MHIHKSRPTFLPILILVSRFLPAFFWILIIFGFDDFNVAALTLLCVGIHELGHGVRIRIIQGARAGLKTTLSGFRMSRQKHISYLADASVYLAGPISNLLAIPIFISLPFFSYEIKKLFFALSLATSLSNLLPIKGYDGYGIISSLSCHFGTEERVLPILRRVSFALILFLCLLSFYIVAKIGSSYWMAGLFVISLIKEIAESLKNNFPSFEEV